jgi:hypothetical protein
MKSPPGCVPDGAAGTSDDFNYCQTGAGPAPARRTRKNGLSVVPLRWGRSFMGRSPKLLECDANPACFAPYDTAGETRTVCGQHELIRDAKWVW